MSWMLRIWLPIAIATTGMAALVYVSVQHVYRETLNDPQIQIAEDAARLLAQNYVPANVVPRGASINLSESHAVWIAVYDGAGKVLKSTGVINNALPQPPTHVFEAAKVNAGNSDGVYGQNRTTWQPEPDLRHAIVVQYFGGERDGFVVVGRNAYEVESRLWALEFQIGLGWLITLIATLVVCWLGAHFSRETTGVVF